MKHLMTDKEETRESDVRKHSLLNNAVLLFLNSDILPLLLQMLRISALGIKEHGLLIPQFYFNFS